jgi:hypothetical protein
MVLLWARRDRNEREMRIEFAGEEGRLEGGGRVEGGRGEVDRRSRAVTGAGDGERGEVHELVA